MVLKSTNDSGSVYRRAGNRLHEDKSKQQASRRILSTASDPSVKTTFDDTRIASPTDHCIIASNNNSLWFSLTSSNNNNQPNGAADFSAAAPGKSSQSRWIGGLESSPLLAKTPLLTHDENRGCVWTREGLKNVDCYHNNIEGDKYLAADKQQLKFRQMQPKDFLAKYGNIKWIGVLLFVFACAFCVYGIIYLNAISSQEDPKNLYVTHLKLVNLFGRHGDRAPSDSLPANDPHRQIIKQLWPRGMSNLTQTGVLRQYRIGLELRRRYGHLIGYNASSVLAFSSPITRCQESIREALRGLFDNEVTLGDGLDMIERCNADPTVASSNFTSDHNTTYHYHKHRHYCHLRSGSGSPLEWQKIPIDIKTIPALSWEYLNACPYRIENPSPVDKDLLVSQSVASLKGLNELSRVLNTTYNMGFNFTSLGLWSSLAAEIRMARTRSTYDFGRQLYDWVNEHVAAYNNSKITLFDLYEQVAVLAYRDRIVGESNWIQLSPLVSAIVSSQLVALGETSNGLPSGSGWSTTDTTKDLFEHKRLIMYSSHDSIMQLLMHRLRLIQADATQFEQRYNKWHRRLKEEKKKLSALMKQLGGHILEASDFNQVVNYDTEMFLDGIKMASFGSSLAFELWEIERIKPISNELNETNLNDWIESSEDDALPKIQITGNATTSTQTQTGKAAKTKFAYVQAVLYNREDAKYDPIVYKRLTLGTSCRTLFREQQKSSGAAKNNNEDVEHSLESFYDFFATANDSDDTGAYGSGHGINVDSESQSDRAYQSASNRELSCPFELFLNVTANLMLDMNKMSKLCAVG